MAAPGNNHLSCRNAGGAVKAPVSGGHERLDVTWRRTAHFQSGGTSLGLVPNGDTTDDICTDLPVTAGIMGWV